MKRLIIVSTFVIILVLGTVIWWKKGVVPVNLTDTSQKIFVIKNGEGVREIANKLKKENLINDPVVFFLLVKQLGLDGKIQAGDFRLSPSMDARAIAENLIHGTLDIVVTIPEGKRADEIADILQEKIPTYQPTWRDQLNKNEGYLFPDTYYIPKNADIALILSLMKNNFEQKYESVPNINNASLPKDQIVIIASLVEREARFNEDRSLVASVIYNRLKIGMPLQIDATIQYVLGYQKEEKTWWKRHLTQDDLHINSSYNTYTQVGLVPTPIANPGLNALQAVVNPNNTSYLYYVSDASGHNHYAKTIDEHNANIQKYQVQ